MTAELQYLHQVWTYENLEQLPDDGYRYEIIDGDLLVTPPPTPEHQDVIQNLRRVVDGRLEHGFFKVGVGMRAPHVGLDRYVIPDACIVVGKRPALYYEPQQIVTAVEVTSPRTISRDRGLKKETYAQHGVQQYWLVDLKKRELRSFQLEHGTYVLEWVMEGDSGGQELLDGVFFYDLTRDA